MTRTRAINSHGSSSTSTLIRRNRVIGYLSEHIFNVSPQKLIVVTIATCLYGVLFVIEGIGLLMLKRWAEYLTVIITLSFIPLEIYELTRKVSPLKIGTLVLNIAIAVYLIVRLKQKSGHRAESSGE